MGEVDGDPPLGWGDDLPDAVLVAGVDVGEGGAGNGPVGSVNDATTRVLAPSLVRVQLVSDPTGAGVSTQGVDTFMLTPMVWPVTLVILLVIKVFIVTSFRF